MVHANRNILVQNPLCWLHTPRIGIQAQKLWLKPHSGVNKSVVSGTRPTMSGANPNYDRYKPLSSGYKHRYSDFDPMVLGTPPISVGAIPIMLGTSPVMLRTNPNSVVQTPLLCTNPMNGELKPNKCRYKPFLMVGSNPIIGGTIFTIVSSDPILLCLNPIMLSANPIMMDLYLVVLVPSPL